MMKVTIADVKFLFQPSPLQPWGNLPPLIPMSTSPLGGGGPSRVGQSPSAGHRSPPPTKATDADTPLNLTKPKNCESNASR